MFRFSKSGSPGPGPPIFFFLFEPPSVQFSLFIENPFDFFIVELLVQV